MINERDRRKKSESTVKKGMCRAAPRSGGNHASSNIRQ
jgi:hypothetical protein